MIDTSRYLGAGIAADKSVCGFARDHIWCLARRRPPRSLPRRSMGDVAIRQRLLKSCNAQLGDLSSAKGQELKLPKFS